jgi:hypothetical protein
VHVQQIYISKRDNKSCAYITFNSLLLYLKPYPSFRFILNMLRFPNRFCFSSGKVKPNLNCPLERDSSISGSSDSQIQFLAISKCGRFIFQRMNVARARPALGIGIYFLENISLKIYFEMETVCFSETLVITYQIARCQNSEGHNVELLSIFFKIGS